MKKSLLLFSLATSALPVWAQADARPNVIVLLADDLGFGDLSCYGATRVSTPAVDSVAAQGVRMTDFHACASTSTPSRYALLTGEYPFRRRGTDVAAGNAASIIDPSTYTLADLFREAGYATAAIGKWHLGLGSRTGEQDWNVGLDTTPRDLGFDYHYIMAATADRVPCVFIEQGRIANYDPTVPVEVSYRQNFAGEPTGRSHPQLLTKLRPSHGHDQSIVNGISRIGYMRGGGQALWKDENIADSIAAHAVGFIERNATRPFFLYLCTNDVHVPRYPHERFRGQSVMGLRGDAILQFDDTVRQLTATLRRLGLEENTLLIITSDNGPVLDDGYADRAVELAGTHQPGGHWRGGKYSAFEAGSVVPFIVRWPKQVGGGQVSGVLGSQIDFLSTMAELLGRQTLPAGSAPDSRRQLPQWLGKSRRDCPYTITMAANRSLQVRQGKWKYIEPSQGGPIVSWGPQIETGYLGTPQLYDVRRNAFEGNNEAERRPKVLRQLQRLLEQVRKGFR